jgi:hypothetical protein
LRDRDRRDVVVGSACGVAAGRFGTAVLLLVASAPMAILR